MKVICAWCENEGKETLIGEISLYDIELTSHGICVDHEKVLLGQIQDLKMKHSPRLRRTRRLASRASRSAMVPNCTTPWRRRRTHRLPAAQLSLPFGDAVVPEALDERELLMATPAANLYETIT
ncbi:MAG TPA: hypothetical protein VJL88_13470 [Nitrospira sp.]|nr:hypothetical protein [Nitrospira sp.]